MNNFSKLWDLESVFTDLVPGAVMIWPEEYCFLEGKSWIEEIAKEYELLIG